ncbi:hypothetical protein EX30DRAFT_137149 [Ascodesmis nigricans]|uniref:ferric-chelate reductase (NADPH) n=1 Tax=Ascodesmis nigricans TaxID=341454 RepID=A0A4S2N0U5_9PEZI|nr:hypothetical protein EX30DRAFT_137149 [Ascodesmis nigricans]
MVGHSHGDLPADSYMAKVYWMFAGAFMAAAVLTHGKDLLEYRLRMRKAARSELDPARPEGMILCALATMTAIVREAGYYAFPLLSRNEGKWAQKVLRIFPRWTHLPPMGHLFLMAANLSLVLSLVFYGFDVKSQWQWEAVAVRAGWITLAQLPLVFLMSGKSNIVGFLTGSSYERLNWIHRTAARTMLVTAAFHMGYFFRSWARYDYVAGKLAADIHTRRGLGAFCVLLWLVVTSVSPVRGWRYEVFFIQHMISGIGFLVIVWMHVPEEAQIYVWFPVGLWVFDRAVRALFLVYNSFSIFHRKGDQSANPTLFACRALFHPLPDKATRITIRNPPFTWKPGQHAFVSCHSLVPFQSHPFTITSLPTDGSLEFVVRAQSGGTGRFHLHACDLLPPRTDETQTVFIDGPYGRMRPLEQFDTVVLIAGSTGASFALPLLRDLVCRKASSEPIVTRRIRLVWVVKGRGQIQWFSKALADGMRIVESSNSEDTAGNGISIDASIFVTCDPELTTASYETVPTPQKSSEGAEVIKGRLPRTSVGGDEKDVLGVAIEDVDSKPEVQKEDKVVTGCGDGTSGCCCNQTVDEDAITDESTPKPCCCCATASDSSTISSTSSDEKSTNAKIQSVSEKTPNVKSKPPSSISTQESLNLPQKVNIVTGRPQIKRIIDKELQKAFGESAVAVCGPRGMVQATRSAVVELCDERAVHKGTGAQGVSYYLCPFMRMMC